MCQDQSDEDAGHVVFSPISAAEISSSALFRTLDQERGTILVDEAEDLEGRRELSSILRSGYTRDTYVQKSEKEGDSYRAKCFMIYGPKALASIGSLESSLADRCIEINTLRAKPGSPKPNRNIDGNSSVWQGIRDDLYTWSLANGKSFLQLVGEDGYVPSSVVNRDREIWKPLLCIAEMADRVHNQGCLKRLHEFINNKYLNKKSENSVPPLDEQILRELTQALSENEFRNGIQCKMLLKRLKNTDPDTFDRFSEARVTSALNRYEIHSRPSNGKRLLCPNTKQLRDIQERYGFDLSLGSDTVGTVGPSKDGKPAAGSTVNSESASKADGVPTTPCAAPLHPFIDAAMKFSEQNELTGSPREIAKILRTRGYEFPFLTNDEVITVIRDHKKHMEKMGREIVERGCAQCPTVTIRKLPANPSQVSESTRSSPEVEDSDFF